VTSEPRQSEAPPAPDAPQPSDVALPRDNEAGAVEAISSPSLGEPAGNDTLRSESAGDAVPGAEAALGGANTVRFGQHDPDIEAPQPSPRAGGTSGQRAEGEPGASAQAKPQEPSFPLPPEGADPLLGQVVGGRWKVLRLLGQGGMGTVYEAQNVAIGKRVALKFIVAEAATDAEVVGRFQREAEAASSVESAHIVQVFDTGTSDTDQPYLVMEYLRGESLGARVRRVGKLPHTEATHIVAQTLRGLARAHEAGVIHRDLKPDNVFLVDRDDDPLFVKILDFGISKISRRPGELGAGTLTRKGTVLGTPYYMSPEQAQAHPDLDGRTDLFSVGAILFECLAGRPPCAGLSTYEAVIVAICSRDAPDVRTFDPDIPPALAAVVAKALARERDQRFSSALAFLEALRAAMPGVVSSRGVSSGNPSSAPRAGEAAAAGASEGPPTRTSWTGNSQVPSITPTLRAPERRGGGRRLAVLGVSTAALAFVATLGAMRLSTEPERSAGAALASPSARQPPEVSQRVECGAPGARVLVDGVVVPDGIIRGPALSSRRVRVEAAGHVALERDVLLDGRPTVRFDLPPEVVPVASVVPADNAEPAPGPGAGSPPAQPPAQPRALPTAKAAGAAGAPAGKKPPQGTGLQLKVNP
jgi:eukaryotic-like serine/threonine-protein kinase